MLGTDGARRADHGLGRHTADIEAVAAHQVTLDQGDFGPQAGRPGCADQSGRAGADDHQVVAGGRFGVFSFVWMNMGRQLLVVRVPWAHYRFIAIVFGHYVLPTVIGEWPAVERIILEVVSKPPLGFKVKAG